LHSCQRDGLEIEGWFAFLFSLALAANARLIAHNIDGDSAGNSHLAFS